MQVGTFVNTDRLLGAILNYEPSSGAFSIEGENISQPINQAQVLALHEKKVIKWDNFEILKSISGQQNMVADAPFKGVELPAVNSNVVSAAPNGLSKVNKNVLVWISIVAVIAVIAIILGITSFKISPNQNIVKGEEVSISQTTEMEIFKYFTDTAAALKKGKEIDLYNKNTDNSIISNTLAQSYVKIYKNVYPKTDKKILSSMDKEYVKAYKMMVEKNINKGVLKGTVFDGQPISVVKNNEQLILSIDVSGKTRKYIIVKQKSTYKIVGILDPENVHEELLGVK